MWPRLCSPSRQDHRMGSNAMDNHEAPKPPIDGTSKSAARNSTDKTFRDDGGWVTPVVYISLVFPQRPLALCLRTPPTAALPGRGPIDRDGATCLPRYRKPYESI